MDIPIPNGQKADGFPDSFLTDFALMKAVIITRESFLISNWQGRPAGSLDLHTLTQLSKSLPSFVRYLFLVNWSKSRHTRFAGNRSQGKSLDKHH